MVLVSDRAGDFGQWANDTQQGASCDLYQTNYELACNCEAETADNYETQGTREAESKAQSESCSWVNDFNCEDYVCS